MGMPTMIHTQSPATSNRSSTRGRLIVGCVVGGVGWRILSTSCAASRGSWNALRRRFSTTASSRDDGAASRQ